MINHELNNPSVDNYRDIEEVAGAIFGTYGVRGVTLTVETGQKTWCSAEKMTGFTSTSTLTSWAANKR